MRRTLTLLLLLLATAVPAAWAQTGTDIITGRVTGPAGEPISGASVRAIAAETGIERGTLTNAQGRFTIVFPQGDGQYQLNVSFLGMAPFTRPLVRIGDEEVLVAEIRMDVAPIMLDGVSVTGRREVDTDRAEPGGQERAVTAEALDRLPIDPTDLAAIAALTPGVIALADSLGAAGFSVLGQGPAGNQITLDGVSFDGGGGAMGSGVPQEAVRQTRVITNTFDVSRGQFSGGQIATTTRAGTNQVQGQMNFSLRDPNLQWTIEDGPFAGAVRQNRVSAGLGGPIIRNRLFYFGSLQLQRRTEGLQSILSADALSLQRLGASPDSVGRFLSVLNGMGLYSPTDIFPDDRIGDNATFLGRLDFNITDWHTLTVRGDARWSQQDNFRGGALGLPQSGSVMENNGGGMMATLTSRFGNGWINEFRAYGSINSRSTVPNQLLPEGRVRVTSDLADGTRGVTNLSFGGGSFGTDSRDETVEVSNELSILRGLSHRIRLGGMLNLTSSTQESSNNRFGTFTFNSLEDFQAGRPASFTRSLQPARRETGGVNAALYVGDTWRVTDRFQLTYGLRGEASRVGKQPEYNPAIETLFGRRTDGIPSELRVSPRVGFSYTLGQGGGQGGFGGFGGGGFGGGRGGGGMGGMGGMAGAVMGGMGSGATVIRGGIGEFRARPPFSLFSSAREATGLPGTPTQLFCVGAEVPYPDWDAFAQSLDAIPTSCISGGGVQVPNSGRASGVTVFDPDFGAARTWRASLGLQRPLFGSLGLNVDASAALGVGQQGMRDLNLNTTPQFRLASEGDRPVFVPQSSIVPRTGQINFLDSRIHPELGQVSEIHSELQSRSAQLTVGVNGMLQRARVFFSSSYTYARSEDQGSGGGWGGMGGGFGGLAGGMGGFGGGFAALPITSGNPNVTEWGRSDFERRHSFTMTAGRNFFPWLDMTVIGRLTSGSAYTPLVGGDINGDGARNDPAFIFNPALTTDALLRADMERLLASSPGRAQECLVSQLGSIASRNSCSSPWNYSLDLRAQVSPTLPGLDRRLTISVDANNTLVGIDQLLHGSSNLRGWGQQSRVDPILLYPRGFDPAAGSYRYEVNERFGAPRQSGLAIRNPFQIQISGRIALGPQRGGARGGFMFGGAPGGAGGRGPAGFAATLNPVASILTLRDTLALEPAQVQRLEAVSQDLQNRQNRLQERMMPEMQRAFMGGNPQAAMQTLQPRLEEARQMVVDALAEAEKVLSAEQWERVPAEMREVPAIPTNFGGQRGPGGQGGQGGQGGRGQGGQGGGAVRPDAAPAGPGGAATGGARAGGVMGMLGGMGNPVATILTLADSLRLDGEQVRRLEGISGELQTSQGRLQQELASQVGQAFQQNPANAMQTLRPRLEEARKQVVDALGEAEKVLTPEQWSQVPADVKTVPEIPATGVIRMGPGGQGRGGQ
jgi:hypothetical protein